MAEETVRRRLAAILSADVTGYSRLMGEDEVGTRAQFNSHLKEVFQPAIERRRGRLVKTTGDGLLLEFASVVDAVQCAIEIQKGMADRNTDAPANQRMEFRIGINLGDVIIEEDDIHGDGVNIAARLEATADPGGICISQGVFDQVKSKLKLDLDDLGNIALKNIEEPVRTYRIVHASQAEKSAAARTTTAATSEALPPLRKRPAVAIMPFRNLNRNPQDDYIANGIGLGIQNLLVQLSGLVLVNAAAHQGYREAKVTAAEAVRDLPIRYVLEGTVQELGSRVRVLVQLTDLRDNAVIWADTYDRSLTDVFALQDDIIREVTSSLGSEILGGELDRISTRGLRSEDAWEHYLRGVSHFYKFTKRDNAVARELFKKLYEQHPDIPLGPANIAITYWFDAIRGWSESPSTSIEQARAWAEMSLEPEEKNNGLGHVILGSILIREGRYDEGLALCRKGVMFRSNCPLALGQLAEAQLFCGDARGAVKTARKALSRRMLYPPPLVNLLAAAYRDSGEVELSITAAREAAALDSHHTEAFVTLCSGYVLAGHDEEAHGVAREIMEIDPEFRISAYARSLPYRESTRTMSIAETLRSAGLPA